MILVFGGTTEGRQAVEVLEEGGQPFYYSTKTGEQDVVLHHGRRIDGAMDLETMCTFCRDHDVRLIVDAAHPFAQQLHLTVADAAEALQLPAIRYERIFPERSPRLTWLDDYDQLPRDIGVLLATTGVQSIARLKKLEQEGMTIVYRILDRESSIALAHRQGASDRQLCFYTEGGSLGDVQADAILMKESGLSGGFLTKVDEALSRGMRVFVLKRPATPVAFRVVNGPFGLRRMVERLLPAFFPLKSGLTTGTCATAASVAAALRLVRGVTPSEVPVRLPNGETIPVAVGYGDGYAYVVKESGDDPDITNGVEVRAYVEHNQAAHKDDEPCDDSGIEIRGGDGVGTFTLPGFDFPPGSAAINRVPRQMIRANVAPISQRLTVTIVVPGGEQIAQKTFNPRLGIEGGISIIGVSGIVKPFSEEAFIESIRKCMEVAKASGAPRVVINSGAKSERYVRKRYPDLPRQAFVEYGNYIGETLSMAGELHFGQVTLGVMLGKAVKLAAGHLDTHSRRATMDKTFVAQMLTEAGCTLDLTSVTLARELWALLPANRVQAFVDVVIAHCMEYCAPLLEKKDALTILLIDDEGNVFESSGRRS